MQSRVLLPVASDRVGFVNVVEGIDVEALIAHTPVEGFNVPVAPRLIQWNVVNEKLTDSEFIVGVGNEFEPKIEPHHNSVSALGTEILYQVGNV